MSNLSREDINALLRRRRYRINNELPLAQLQELINFLETPEPLERLIVPVLRDMMRSAGLSGYSRMRKDELLTAIRAARSSPSAIPAPASPVRPAPVIPAPVIPAPVIPAPAPIGPISSIDTLPTLSQLQREARAQDIDPSGLTQMELSYILRYQPLEEVTAYSLPTMTKPIFVYLMSFPPLSVARLQALKEEPANILATNIGYATITESISTNSLHTLWAANVNMNADIPLVPTDDVFLYTTIAGSRARKAIARVPSEINTIYIRRTNAPHIVLYNDNDALSRALLHYPPLTVGRWLAVCDPTFQERATFLQRHTPPGVNAYLLGGSNHVVLTAATVDDRRPQSIGPYHPELEFSYTLEDLHSFALAEGLDPGDASASTLRQILRRQQSAPTFYQEVDARRCEPPDSVYGDEYVEVPARELYAYGSRTNRSEPVRCYQRDELAQQFTSQRQFVDPLTQAPFSPESIRRLELLSERDETAEGHAFTRSIINLREEQADLDRQVRPLVERLRSATPAQQIIIKLALKALLEVAMYMRKWPGPPEPYPIKASKTFQSVDPDIVQNRVGDAIGRLRDILEELPAPLQETFWQLPLKRFAEGRYYSSTEATNGLTIRQRLDIVVENRGTAACLRLSSNWFLYSALYWSTLLFREDWGIDPAEVEAIG